MVNFCEQIKNKQTPFGENGNFKMFVPSISNYTGPFADGPVGLPPSSSVRWDVAEAGPTTRLSCPFLEHCWETSMLFRVCWLKKRAWHSFSQESCPSRVNNNNPQAPDRIVSSLKHFLFNLYSNPLKLTLLLLTLPFYDDEHWGSRGLSQPPTPQLTGTISPSRPPVLSASPPGFFLPSYLVSH